MASSVDNNASEDLIEVKDWFLLGTDLESLGHREFLQYANDHLGTSANLSAWDEYFKGKNIALDLALNWDHSKNTETNLAEMSVNQVEAITFGALVGLVSKNAFLGVLAGFGFSTLAKKLGLDGEGVVEHLKKYLQDHPEVSNSLTPEEKKKLEESGFLFPKPKTIEVSVVSTGDRYESQGAITFKVILSAPLTQAITIDLVTLDGSAQMGSDYSANSKFTVTIPAGSRVGYYSVPLKDDDAGEETESFTVAPYNAWYYGKETIFLKSAGYGVILDDDGKGDGDDGYYDNIPVISNQNFSSPLVLDLNGDGVTSTFIYDTQTYFDLNNDGIRERTAWTQNGDGILVFDKNQDGMINNGNELFGNNTTLKNGTKAANGFEALKEYDENRDYVIDNSDNIYHALRIWQDSNRDGISQANELKTLEEMNIQAIGVIYADTESYEGQNVARQRSFFIGENADGSWKAGMVNDVWFETNNRDTARNTDVILKDSVESLPDYRGAGRMDNLSVAMNENTELETAVTALLSKASVATYDSLLSDTKNILALWAKTENISATATRGEQYILNHNYGNTQPVYRYRIYAYARDVAILESFWGQNFTMTVDGKTTSDVIGTEMSAYMTNAINTLTDTVLATLLVQSLYGKDAYDVTRGQFDYMGLFSKLTDTLNSGTINEKTLAANLLATLIHRDGLETLSHLDTALLSDTDFKTLLQTNGIKYTINPDGTFSGSYKDTVEGGSGNDTLTATNSGTVYGGDGNDTIYGQNATDEHNNATGHEELHGGDGNDTIIGGTGDDILYGDAGDDILYANGRSSGDTNYGHDFLIGGEGNDTLVGTGRNSTYVYNYGDGNDTIIDGGNVGVTDDVLELRGIRFEDITVGSSGNDMVIRIKDILNPDSDSGSITIKNGMSNGKIEQFVFDNQTLSFSTMQLIASNLLHDDIYTLNRGDGIGTILDYASINGDTLQFGDGITADDIMVKVSLTSNNLIVALKEEGKSFSNLSDKLTITNWFNPDNRIEIFSFSDGTTWDANAILAHQGTDEADTTRLLDTTSGITLDLGGGNDVITTGSGNDTLVGGTGDDTLSGGSGNDTYMFTKGDGIDAITDTSGIDTLQFGGGVNTSDLITYVSPNTNDLIVAIKEDGIAFDQLSDKITLKNWFIVGNRIESFHFTDGTIWNVNDIISTQATDGDDVLHPINLNESINIHLLGGDDFIDASNVDDTIYGDSGNDTINAGTGNDTLVGGTGNDTLRGGGGNDRYVFAKGDGADTVFDEGRSAPYYWAPYYTVASDGGADTLQFADGVTASDLLVKASANSNDLIVALKEDGKTFAEMTDKITLKNWFNADNRIEAITFSDGTVWNVNDIVNAQGTEDADTVHLIDTMTDVVLDLQGGDDSVLTGNGNDTIAGGTGDDLLKGGGGDDTYLFKRGDGADTIMDVSGIDVLSFGSDITEDDIVVLADEESDDLIVALKEDGKIFAELSDKITLKNWYLDENRIERFIFSDQSELNTLAITELQTADNNDNYLRYLDHDNTINAHEGNDSVEGGAGNDTYLFSRGDGIDHIIDSIGLDTLVFGAGITQDDIEVHADNNYLIIGLKEDAKGFHDLSDKVYFKRLDISDYGVETIRFADGTEINPRSLISTYDGTNNNDLIDLEYLKSINPTVLIDDNLAINAKAGADTVTVGNGDNKITMGDGNNEILSVGNGDNQIDMGTGWNKTLIAGDGTNLINTTQTDIDILLGEGDNTINAGYYTNVTAGSGNNTIHTMTSGYTVFNANFGDGNNTIIEEDGDSFYGGEGYLYRYNTISVGDGNNQISVKNGDGSLYIRTGNGDNNIEFSADVDRVYINYAGEDQFTGNVAGDNTITQLVDTDVEYSYYDYYGGTGELINVSNPNIVNIGLNDGNNHITLSDVAQDYQLNLGDGNNAIAIGHENSDSNYVMSSSISVGDGDNQVNILSGDANLTINAGFGNNTISLSSDIDNAVISVGDGDNTIVQTIVKEMDDFGNNTNITMGIGSNTVILGYGNDSVHLSNNAYDELYSGAIGQADRIDSGAGSNYIDIKSNADHTVSIGADNYQDLSSYKGYDYNELYLGNGDNTIMLKGADKVYAEIGDGNNTVSISNTNLTDLQFDGGNNTITMDKSSTLLNAHYSNTNSISSGAGADKIYTLESNDTYNVNIGDGSDVILDMYGVDIIIFGEGIDRASIKVSVEFYDDLLNNTDNPNLLNDFTNSLNSKGYSSDVLMNTNLVIHYSDNPADKLTLVNWYNGNGRIEQFKFADGSTLKDHQLVGLIGTDANDTVLGTEGDNTIHGGAGDDAVEAGQGNDAYVYNRGDAHDTFNDEGGFDTIAFGTNITKDKLILQKVDNNLLISLKEDGKTTNDLFDTITVSDWFNPNGRIERFTFTDGSSMELNEVLTLVDASMITYYGTPEEDIIVGTANSDIILAKENNDIIDGKEGDDLLFGEAGNDTLIGGLGNDLLYGGEGSDTYMIDRNMGDDVVFDQNGTDTLRFADGITSEDISVWYDNNDLKIWVEGSEITLTDWYRAEHRIETFTFANGVVLNVNDIINLQGEEVKGVSKGSTFDVDDGDTIYYAQEGNDVYRIGTYAGVNSIIDAGGIDRVEFAEAITTDSVVFSYEGDDLIIELEGTTVYLSGWYTMQNRIETFYFSDGTVLDAQGIIDRMETDAGDMIRTLEEGSSIHADLGDDTLTAANGDNILVGGEGNDTYLITQISGIDTIEDSIGVDILRFGGAITPDNLRITWIQGSDDIRISLGDSDMDGVILKNWYVSENRIETVLFEDGMVWNTQDILDAMGSDEDDVYNGFKDQANILHANDGSDVVSTFGFDDTLYGGAGNDSLDAGDGDDTLIGEEGDDLLFGGAGDDTYFFDRGFGKDIIFEDAFGGADSAGDDRIVFGAGVIYDDVIVRSYENDNNLYIALKENGKQFDELSDVITIKDWFLSANRIESISFGDGNEMSLIDVMYSKAANEGEAIRALGDGGMLIGTNDEDTLIGNKGDDFILGLEGNDDLIGADGNDTLVGGMGNDTLEGSGGNDTYFFGHGDGQDSIYDNAVVMEEQYGYVTDNEGIERWSKIEHEYSIDGGSDTVYFGEGITTDDLILKNEGFDLLITLKDSTDDVLRIQDYYKPFNTIEFFGFSDGTILSGSEFEALLFTPEDDDVMFVDDQDRILNGNEGDDSIHAGSGNDIIDGAGGDDTLNGGFGDDVYLFGRGSGHDTITDNGIGEWWQTRSGNDTVFFKEGINRDDLWVKEDGNDLLIAIREEDKAFEELSDTLRIIGALDESNPFESVVFANGVNVSIAILLNQAPEALAEVSNTLQDIRILSGEVGATDIDGDVLSYTVSTEASHGMLSVDENGVWNYSAADGYIGSDSAVITIDDGNGGVITQTLNFNIIDATASSPILEMTLGEIDIVTKQVVVPGSRWRGNDPLAADIGITSTISTPIDTNPTGLNAGDNALALEGSINLSILKAYDGNDLLDISQTPRDIDMGAGNDILRIRTDAAGKIWLGTGADTLEIFGNAQALTAGDGADRVKINVNANGTVELGADNDDLDIGGDANLVYGGTGDDRIQIAHNALGDIQLNDGSDYLYIGGAVGKSIDAGIGNDTVIVGEHSGSIYLRDGNDTLVVRSSTLSGTVEAGAGNDTLWLQGVSQTEWLNTAAGLQSRITGFENIKFSDGTYIGNAAAFDTINTMLETTTNVNEYRYSLTLNASLSDNDGSESLSALTLSGLPPHIRSVVVSEQTLSVTQGSFTLDTPIQGAIQVTFVSPSLLESMELGNITASISSTESYSGDTVTTSVSYTTPILLDMNGDGVHTVSIDKGVSFDINADGLREYVGWSDGIDAFLVRDLNHDGDINDGSELFGSATTLANGTKAKEGYAALSDLDDNHDTMLTGSDQAFAELSLWIDANLNAQTEEGEILSLSEAHISSLHLSNNQINRIDKGNIVAQTSLFTFDEGRSFEMADLWFVTQSSKTNTTSNTIDFDHIIQSINAFKDDDAIDTLPYEQTLSYPTANLIVNAYQQ